MYKHFNCLTNWELFGKVKKSERERITVRDLGFCRPTMTIFWKWQWSQVFVTIILLEKTVSEAVHPAISYCLSPKILRPISEGTVCETKEIIAESGHAFNSMNFLNFGNDVRTVVLRCTASYPIQWLDVKPFQGRMVIVHTSTRENGSFEQEISISLHGNRILRCQAFANARLGTEVYLASRQNSDDTNIVFAGGSSQNVSLFKIDKSRPFRVPCAAAAFERMKSWNETTLVKYSRNKKVLGKISLDCIDCLCESTAYDDQGCGYISYTYYVDGFNLENPSGANPEYDTCKRNETCRAKYGDYLSCVANKTCSQANIKNYMDKYTQSGAIRDCNGDGLITCLDYAKTQLLGPGDVCKDALNPDWHGQFARTFPSCIQGKENFNANTKVMGYNPSYGFLVDEIPDFGDVYACSHASSHMILAPVDSVLVCHKLHLLPCSKRSKFDSNPPQLLYNKIPGQLNYQNGGQVGLECNVDLEERSKKNVYLTLGTCDTLDKCDFKFKPYLFFSTLPYQRPGELHQVMLLETNRLVPQVNHGYVECSGIVDPSWSSNASLPLQYIQEIDYMFTGLDRQKYLYHQNFPSHAIIDFTDNNMKPMKTKTSYNFDCKISTFVLHPVVYFQLDYKTEGKAPTIVRTTQSSNLPVIGPRIVSLAPDLAFAKGVWRLQVELTTDAKRIMCFAPWINSTEFAMVQVDLEVFDEDALRENENSSRNAAIAGSFSVILIVALVVIAVLWKRYLVAKRRIRDLTEEEVEEFYHGNETKGADGTIAVENLAFNANKMISSDSIVKDEEILGEGQFGIVSKGSYADQVVAIKMTKSTADVDYFKAFLKELKVMSYIGDHENIVKFHGAVVDKIKERMCLAVIEYCPHGNLTQYLRNNSPNYQRPSMDTGNTSEPKLTEAVLLEYCLQIANGMQYLAEKKVVHGDLATRNVLVFDGNRVKITDFGLSRKLYGCANYVKKQEAPLPWRWMAIETLRYLEFSTQSDVWSYGVTLWEIFTLGQVPYSGLTWTVDFVEDLERGNRLSKPVHASTAIFEMVMRCWETEASARPNFTDLLCFFQDYTLPKPNLEPKPRAGKAPTYMNYP